MDRTQQKERTKIPQFALVVVTHELVDNTWVATGILSTAILRRRRTG